MDIALKDESVIKIGKEISAQVGGVIKTGTSMAVIPQQPQLPAGEVSRMDPQQEQTNPALELLTQIRDGILDMVQAFTQGVNLQEDIRADNLQQNALDQAGSGEDSLNEDLGDDPGPSRFDKIKDGAKKAAMGLKELLIKGALIGGLLAVGKFIGTYAEKIAEYLGPVVDGFKKGWETFSGYISPLTESLVGIFTDLKTGLSNIITGLFGKDKDATTLFAGIKTLFLDLPIKALSFIGQGVTAILDTVLTALGIESQWVKDLNAKFKELPDTVKKLWDAAIDFITVKIPAKITAFRDAIKTKFEDFITGIKDKMAAAWDFITVTIPTSITNLKTDMTDGIKSMFKPISDFFSGIGSWISDAVAGVLDSLPIGDTIRGKIKSALGIVEPAMPDFSETGGFDPNNPNEMQAWEKEKTRVKNLENERIAKEKREAEEAIRQADILAREKAQKEFEKNQMKIEALKADNLNHQQKIQEGDERYGLGNMFSRKNDITSNEEDIKALQDKNKILLPVIDLNTGEQIGAGVKDSGAQVQSKSIEVADAEKGGNNIMVTNNTKGGDNQVSSAQITNIDESVNHPDDGLRVLTT
mgnify:CR=1 FL=1|jgi:hypothetical protein